jgi:hypothetical protein
VVEFAIPPQGALLRISLSGESAIWLETFLALPVPPSGSAPPDGDFRCGHFPPLASVALTQPFDGAFFASLPLTAPTGSRGEHCQQSERREIGVECGRRFSEGARAQNPSVMKSVFRNTGYFNRRGTPVNVRIDRGGGANNLVAPPLMILAAVLDAPVQASTGVRYRRKDLSAQF